MKTLQQLRTQLAADEFDFSDHGQMRSRGRGVTRQDVQQAGSNAELLEYYPNDKYTPSCLLLGFTETGRPLYILVSVEDAPLVKVITVYQPDPARWRDHRENPMTPRCIVCYGREHVDVLTGFNYDVLGHDVIIDDIPATMCVDCGELSYGRDADDNGESYDKLIAPIIAAHAAKGITEETYQARRTQIIVHGYRDWEDTNDYGTYTEDGVFHPTPPEIMEKIEALRAKNRGLAAAPSLTQGRRGAGAQGRKERI